MSFKQFSNELNIIANCKKYGISIWQCPQFLFLIMGGVIIITSLITYSLGTRYVANPNTVSLIVLVLTTILLVITFSITRTMEGLAEANRLKSEFVSIVSHQLRSPLSNLKWVTEFLLSGRLGKLSAKHDEYLQILKDNTIRMGELVSDLLTVSRIEHGKMPLNKAEFSLLNLAKETISEFEPAAKASNIKVSLEVASSLSLAFGDVSRIKIVTENFLENAIHYTNKGGEIQIKIEKKNKNLILSMKDNGIGIPKKDQQYIAQKFFRSKNVLKRQTHGSGLGLYIAKSIIERSGGKLGFRSQENKGSTFWFTIPTKN